jgi:hypothetical protein
MRDCVFRGEGGEGDSSTSVSRILLVRACMCCQAVERGSKQGYSYYRTIPSVAKALMMPCLLRGCCCSCAV